MWLNKGSIEIHSLLKSPIVGKYFLSSKLVHHVIWILLQVLFRLEEETVDDKLDKIVSQVAKECFINEDLVAWISENWHLQGNIFIVISEFTIFV